MLLKKIGILATLVVFVAATSFAAVSGGRSSVSVSRSSSSSFSSKASATSVSSVSKPSSSGVNSGGFKTSVSTAPKQTVNFSPPSNKQTVSMWGTTKTSATTPPIGVAGNKNAYVSKVPNNAQVKQGFMGTSVFDKKTADTMKLNRATTAKQTREAEIKKFQAPPVATPTYSQSYYKESPVFKDRVVYGGQQTWKRDRDNYYNRRWNNNTPSYIYMGSPSYGAYDALFMWSFLEMHDKDTETERELVKLLKSQQETEEFKKWRADAEKLALTDHAIRKKLDAMDTKVADPSIVTDPNFVPTSVPLTAIYSQETLANLKKAAYNVNIDTGSNQGVYHMYETKLVRQGKDTFNYTEKTEPNVQLKYNRYMNGEADMIMAPVDALNVVIGQNREQFMNATETAIPMYKEVMVMLTARNSNVNKMTNIDEDITVIAATEGSGTDITWRNIAKIHEKYGKAKIINMPYDNPSDPMLGVFSYLKNNKNAVLLYQGGVKSAFLRQAEQQSNNFNLRIVDMNDDDIASIAGNSGPVYQEATLPDNTFPALQKEWFFTDEKTIYAVDAVLLVSKKWAEKNGTEAVDEIVEDTIAIQSDMELYVNGFEI